MRASTCVRSAVGGILLTVSLAALADNAVTTDSAGVYAGPDSAYPEVAQLDPDTPIQVMGCLDDWSWCDVTFEGNRGWLYSPDISFQYQGGYVPFYSYAPSFGVSVVSFSVDSYWGHYYQGRPWFAQRAEWEHRTVEHRRPAGPPPRSGPPPHDVVQAERPHGGGRPDQGVRLSSADRPHQDADRAHQDAGRPHQDAVRHDADSGHGDARPADHAPPHAERAAPSHAEPEHMAPQHDDKHVAPQHEDKVGRPAEREEAAHRAPPPKDDKDEHPH